MIARFWLMLGVTLASIGGYSQCLTDFEKLLPEPSTDYSLDFGRATALYDGVMAVTAPNSDNSVRLGGVVYLYQKAGNDWVQIGMLEPSTPQEGLLFGYNIKMTKDYIIVGAYGYGGRVYIFKKPASGWTSLNEIAVLSQPNTYMFGANHYANNSIDISIDQQTLVINDPSYWFGGHSGAVFIYHKSPLQEWNSLIAPSVLFAPESSVTDFGVSGVSVLGTRVIAGSPYTPFGGGSIYVFNDASGSFGNLQLEAVLNPASNPNETFFFSYSSLIVTEAGIYISAVVKDALESQFQILFFEKPLGSWVDNNAPCKIHPSPEVVGITVAPRLAASLENPDKVFTSFRQVDGVGKVVQLTRTTDWCNVVSEVIFSHPALPTGINNFFGSNLACDQNDNVVVGPTPLPDNATAQLSLTALSKMPDNSWNSALIFNSIKSTSGHFYGRNVLGFEDYLFVTAPYDGTIKSSGGAVYAYKKVGSDWQKTNKIIPPFTSVYDDVFGTALASNGQYLAVGAAGFEPHGKILIYKKTTADWSTVELVQEISTPDELDPYASGDNIAMDDHWLIVPAVTMSDGARINLSIYEFNGTDWDHFQNIEIGMANFFARESTVAIDIQDETIVAGGIILQRNTSGQWEIRFTLYPSDSEPMQIAPDFSHWITNGDRFGTSVDIDGDNIFIGAPTKDDGATWDVGAVYVYTKKPGKNWESGTETAKILPRIRDERELFGYSLKAMNNTLIVGAPGADYNKDGVSGRNKPGRSYVYQSKDFYWQDVIPLLDFAGDSAEKDYFGINVNLDETDFFISASIEDNAGDQLSGSVYITPTPPIIKLVPPVCSSEDVIDLFGFPFGGIWAGPGILDAAEGTFDPKIAGIGIHEFTYQTPSCHFLGRLRIEVKAPPNAIVVGDPVKYICDDGSSSTIISIEEHPDVSYQWYYRKVSTDLFTLIAGTTNALTVTKTGEYRARVFDGACENFSSTFLVAFDGNPITIDPTSVICDDAVKSITLKATPAGGTWKGDHILNGKFDASFIASGTFVATYHYTSVYNCPHFLSTAVVVDRIPELNYQRSSNNLCDKGEVELALTPNRPNLNFEWQQNLPSGSEIMDEDGQVVMITENGTYQAKVSNDYCSKTLPPYTFNDKFSVHVLPEATETEACSLVPFFFTSDGKTSDTFSWFYAENENDGLDVLTSNNNPQLEIMKSGFYKLQVQRGVCSFESDIKQITILPGDSLYIPNVFSPNDDGKNDVFKVSTLNDYIDLKVMNRYGQKIYEGDGVIGWDGGDHPSAVYFWSIVFRDCEGSRQLRKGMVHLVR